MCLSGQQVMGVGSHSVAVHRAIIHGYAGQLEEFFFCLTGPYLNGAGDHRAARSLPWRGAVRLEPPEDDTYAPPVVSFYRLPVCLSPVEHALSCRLKSSCQRRSAGALRTGT